MEATPGDAGVLFDSGRMFYGRLPRTIIGGTAVLLGVILFAMASTGTLQSEPVAGMALAGALLLTAFLGFGFSRIQVRENEVQLRWFPFYLRRIPVTAIRRAAPVAIHGLRYGFGLRFGTFGLGIIQDTGPAVRLDAGRGYLLSLGSVDRQTRFLEALAAAGVDVQRP